MTLAGRIAIGDAASSAERALPRHGESRSLRRMSIVLLLALAIPVSPCAAGSPPITQDAPTTQSPQEGDRMALFKDPKDGHFDTSRWLLVTASAAAGIKTSFEDLLKLGWQPVAMLIGETVFIVALVLAAIVALRLGL